MVLERDEAHGPDRRRAPLRGRAWRQTGSRPAGASPASTLGVDGPADWLALFSRASEDVFWDWTPISDLLAWSSTFQDVFHYPAGEAPATFEAWRGLIHPEDRPRVAAEVDDFVSDRKDEWRTEYRFLRGDGSYAWVIDHGASVRDRQGRVVRFIGSLTDVTARKEGEAAIAERKQYEAQALESEARYRSLFEHNADAVFAVDLETRFTEVNAAAEKVSGYSPDELVGREFPFLVEEDDLDRVFAHYLETVQGKPQRFEMRIKHKQGHTVHLSIIGIPLFANGEVKGIYGIAKDISTRKLAQERERDERARLEEAVRHRTQELTLANQELEAFGYSVSHDLRAPLRGIDYYAQVLEEDYGVKLDEEGRMLVSRIRQESQRLGELVQTLLQLSRIVREPLEIRRIDLSALAETVAGELRQAEPARVTDVVVEPGLWADADPRLMHVVFENLIGNAWKYTSTREHPRIDVGATTTSRGEQAYFVHDNGVGFDPALASRLFQPFQRLHSAKDFEGTGVGLATVARVVRRHGGRVWADAAPDKGATFSFTLKQPD